MANEPRDPPRYKERDGGESSGLFVGYSVKLLRPGLLATHLNGRIVPDISTREYTKYTNALRMCTSGPWRGGPSNFENPGGLRIQPSRTSADEWAIPVSGPGLEL